MPLTNSGRDYLAAAIMADGAPTPFDNTNAHIGAGDSNTAFDASQTDLQASSNKLRKGMEATYPQRSSNTLTFRALFGTGEANYQWREWGIFNHATAGTMLTRDVDDVGTKTSFQSWLVEADLDVEIGS